MPTFLPLALHIDLDAPFSRNLMVSSSDSSALNSPVELVAGDNYSLDLYFWRRSSTPGALIAHAFPATDKLRLCARPLGLPSGSELLIYSDDFARATSLTNKWSGSINLNTAELIAHLAASPAGPKTITCEIEISNEAETSRRSLQFSARALPQAYENQDAPTSMPTPESAGYIVGHAGVPENAVRAIHTITVSSTGGPTGSGGDTITISGVVYHFVDTFPEDLPNHLLPTYADLENTLAILATAINEGTAGDPDNISPGTVPHPVFMANSAANVITLTANVAGSAANDLGFSYMSANLDFTCVAEVDTPGLDATPGKVGDIRCDPYDGRLYIVGAVNAGLPYWFAVDTTYLGPGSYASPP